MRPGVQGAPAASICFSRFRQIDFDQLTQVAERALFNSIGAMFQFQGGISDGDKEKIFSELQKRRHIVVGENGRVHYPEV
jgi:hypothetical protein